MKRSFSFPGFLTIMVLFGLFLTAVACAQSLPEPAAGTATTAIDTLTIIHVNDTHSNLLPYAGGKLGGMARAASVIEQWRRNEPNPILVHCGDFMVGTLMFNTYFGVPEVQLLQRLGFDALLLGNHEFDGGATQLGKILNAAKPDSTFHILCSNARHLEQVPALQRVVRFDAVVVRGRLRVGLFGLTTPATNVESNPAPVFIDTALVKVAQQEIETLHRQGAQVVLMLSHLGLPLDRRLASQLSGLDAIIGGHSHSVVKQVIQVNGIPIVQAGEFYRYVGKLRLIYDGTATRVLDYTLKEIDPTVPEAPEIAATLSRLQQGVTAEFTPRIGDPYRPVSRMERLLTHRPVPSQSLSTPVGNLVTAALRWYVPESDCALEPTGHIVENLYPGPVTAAELFRVYPYGYDATDHLGFRLATLQLSGGEIRAVLAALLPYIDFHRSCFDYLMQSNGLRFTIEQKDSIYALGSVRIGGQPVQEDALYTVVTSRQTAGYLTKLFGMQPRNLHIYPVSVFQVLKNYVEAQTPPIHSTASGNALIRSR